MSTVMYGSWVKEDPAGASRDSTAAATITFANESFMDELAFAARTAALKFRLRHLDDPHAQAVLNATADRFG